MAERAKQLGFTKVVVIEEDLGRSGAGTQERPGFGRSLASVCQGWLAQCSRSKLLVWRATIEIGINLVDLCALAETLLIDSDGIYDPRVLNDRLLLGLKGSMAEFELGLLRQRAREAFEQKVRICIMGTPCRLCAERRRPHRENPGSSSAAGHR